MEMVKQYGPPLGRVLLALIFVISGFGKITGFDGTVGYIQSAGLPAPQLAAIVAIVVELGAGLMLIVGWKARWAALALFVFVIVATLFFHAFWAVPEDQKQLQMIMFLKNLAIMGGLLYVAAAGPGSLSAEKA